MEYDGVIMSKHAKAFYDQVEKLPPLKFLKLEGIDIDWLVDTLTDLPELKQYDCLDELYDELGEYE